MYDVRTPIYSIYADFWLWDTLVDNFLAFHTTHIDVCVSQRPLVAVEMYYGSKDGSQVK